MIEEFFVIIICGLALMFVVYYYLQCDRYKYRLHKEIETNNQMKFILQRLQDEDVKLLNREEYNIIIAKNDMYNNVIDVWDDI